jgi:phenylacetate-coenzyme A ligase PaaK-like adenylate-forming protein
MTDTYVIEKNVPLAKTELHNTKYPFLRMEIGDSFFVANVARQKVGSAAYVAGRVHGRTFKTRTVEGGVRVWRVA